MLKKTWIILRVVVLILIGPRIAFRSAALAAIKEQLLDPILA